MTFCLNHSATLAQFDKGSQKHPRLLLEVQCLSKCTWFLSSSAVNTHTWTAQRWQQLPEWSFQGLINYCLSALHVHARLCRTHNTWSQRYTYTRSTNTQIHPSRNTQKAYTHVKKHRRTLLSAEQSEVSVQWLLCLFVLVSFNIQNLSGSLQTEHETASKTQHLTYTQRGSAKALSTFSTVHNNGGYVHKPEDNTFLNRSDS